jgi:hypothetical protein
LRLNRQKAWHDPCRIGLAIKQQNNNNKNKI